MFVAHFWGNSPSPDLECFQTSGGKQFTVLMAVTVFYGVEEIEKQVGDNDMLACLFVRNYLCISRHWYSEVRVSCLFVTF